MKTNRLYTFVVFVSLLLVNESVKPMPDFVQQIITRPTNTKKLLFETIYCFGRGIMIHRTIECGIRLLKSPPPKESVKKLGRKLTELIRTIYGLSVCTMLCYLCFSPDLDVDVKNFSQTFVPHTALLYGIYHG